MLPSGERPRVLAAVAGDEIEIRDLELEENEIDDSLDGLELDLSPEQQQRISDVFVRLHAVDFYALLAVPRTADTKAIKRAYNEWVSTLHPDRFFRKRLGTFKRKLDSIFMRLTEAHDLLCSPEHRAEYDELLLTRRRSLVDEMVAETLAEMAGSEENAHRESVEFDSSVRVGGEGPSVRQSARPSGVQAAIRVVSAEDIACLQELHETRKRRGHLEPEERERYDVLREQFARAFEAAQQLDLPEGQTYRRVLRVPCAIRLTLSMSGRAHNTITLDLSAHGLAALVRSSLPVNARCDLVLHVSPEPVCARARIVSSVNHGSGNTSFRVSLEFEPLEEPAAERLETIVLDAALRRATKSG